MKKTSRVSTTIFLLCFLLLQACIPMRKVVYMKNNPITEKEITTSPPVHHLEIGDVLFAVVNLARFLDIPAEDALRKTNQKFTNRFAKIEEELKKRGKTLEESSLEEMDEIISSEREIYGMGEIIKANKRGYKSETGKEILLTPYMLINTDLYSSLRPFIHHGQPTLHNFSDAASKGFMLKAYKISDYIDHIWRGTADRFGYGLGFKGKLDYLLNKLGL